MALTEATTRRRRRIRIVLVVCAGVFAVAGLVTIDSAGTYNSVGRTKAALPGSGGGGRTYLILGSDSRDGARTVAGLKEFGADADIRTSGSDIIMVLRVSDVGPPRLVSIPRDLIVDFPGEGPNRITLAFARGLPLTIETFCSALGIGVDHALVVGFDGFIALIDAVGGIDLDLKYPMRDLQSGLDIATAGAVNLDGRRALAYVRSRHPEVEFEGRWLGIPDASDTRLVHSKEVLKQVASKSRGSRTNPWRARSIVQAAAGALTVDEQMGPGDFREVLEALNETGFSSAPASSAPASSGSDGGNLPVLKHADELGTSELNAGSLPVLDSLGSGRNRACPRPAPRRFVDGASPESPRPVR